MSLIGFHRFLIASGILFCFGFAVWEMVTWWVTRSTGALVLTVLFLIFGVGLTYYLSRLRDFVGYREED